MGKILKYCSSCEEGFAERFAFCPDCGASLQTFEMNPVTGEAIPQNGSNLSADPNIEAAPITDQFAGIAIEEPVAATTESFSHPAEIAADAPKPAFLAEEATEDIRENAAAGSYSDARATDAFSSPSNTTGKNWSSLVADGVAPEFKLPTSIAPDEAATFAFVADGPAPAFRFPKITQEAAPPFKLPNAIDEEFGLTVINDSNTKQKNRLLLGATTLMIVALLTGVVVSIFGKSIDIGSIGSDDVFTWIPEVDPISIDVEQEKVKKDDSGGGGGGGNKEQDPASKGTNAAMMKDPLVAPSSHMDRLSNPSLTMPVGVKGPDRPMVDTNQPYGVPNGADKLSDGPGTGTGIGTGRNGGQGSGDGPGLGTGSGGGAGNGRGGGIGDGDGPDGGGPPPGIAKVSTPVKIISKPKAPYTDEARQNNVQGSVTLKITFLASGQIGSVTAVTRLPYGLTENAIAAAKQIRFEPKKINGVPVSTSMTFQYGFNIY